MTEEVELWVPMDVSTGSCYHSTKCGAHSLKTVDLSTVQEEYTELKPCKNCVNHHGLGDFIMAYDLPNSSHANDAKFP